MKKILLLTLFVAALIFSFEQLSETQTKPEGTQSEQDKERPKLIALKLGEPDELSYDAGTLGF